MTTKAFIDAVESYDLPKMTLAERLIYLYLVRDSDVRHQLRLSQSDLAARLGVTRQTIVKHIESLREKHLVRHTGHGRYCVYPRPWSIDEEVRDYLLTLKPGDVVVPSVVSRALWDMDSADLEDREHTALYGAFNKVVGRLCRLTDDSDWVRI